MFAAIKIEIVIGKKHKIILIKLGFLSLLVLDQNK